MSRPAEHHTKATLADLLAAPAERRLELVDGELIEKASPDEPHADTQGALVEVLRGSFNKRPGGRFPGGWWIRPEIDIRLGENSYRPDVAGWRRERVPEMPIERPLPVRPDWVCEVISESNASHDLVVKLEKYGRAGIPHYWIVDPRAERLVVWRLTPSGYLNVLSAARGEVVRAEPFDAIEIVVGVLFGDDPED